jgi:hypothetical protein
MRYVATLQPECSICCMENDLLYSSAYMCSKYTRRVSDRAQTATTCSNELAQQLDYKYTMHVESCGMSHLRTLTRQTNASAKRTLQQQLHFMQH